MNRQEILQKKERFKQDFDVNFITEYNVQEKQTYFKDHSLQKIIPPKK